MAVCGREEENMALPVALVHHGQNGRPSMGQSLNGLVRGQAPWCLISKEIRCGGLSPPDWAALSNTFLTSGCAAAQLDVCHSHWQVNEERLVRGKLRGEWHKFTLQAPSQLLLSSGFCQSGWAQHWKWGSPGHIHGELLVRVNKHLSPITNLSTASKTDLSENIFLGVKSVSVSWKEVKYSLQAFKCFSPFITVSANISFWRTLKSLCF